MWVVKRKSTGEIIYRQSPDFESGFGIKNATIIAGIPENDLEEVEVTQIEWDKTHPISVPPRDLAVEIDALKARLETLEKYIPVK